MSGGLTRKHFRALAAAVAGGDEPDSVKLKMAEFLADVLAETNPRFRRGLFIAACLLPVEGGCRGQRHATCHRS